MIHIQMRECQLFMVVPVTLCSDSQTADFSSALLSYYIKLILSVTSVSEIYRFTGLFKVLNGGFALNLSRQLPGNQTTKMSSSSVPTLNAGTVGKPPPYAPLKDEPPPSYGSIAVDSRGYPIVGQPQRGYPQPPNGPQYYPVPPQPVAAQQVTTTTYSTQVVVVGGCPACRVGILEDDFTLLGVCCAILFFPFGILCCLAMRQRRCPNCGAVFG
ncbi:membrane protein BRI3-like [Diadema antillarum]|uniref:membrane protein BRI3-like n=1 Tax=Diadema antillarum TaxID=105358 RepID=UPI003A83FEDD